MTDIERLLERLARDTGAEAQHYYRRDPLISRYIHVDRGRVRPDSVTAMLRLLDHVFGRVRDRDLQEKNEKARMFRALVRVSDLRDKMDEEHEPWMRGGVHPQGTRARERADAKRHAKRVRRNHAINRVLLVVVRRCARHYGWVEPTTMSGLLG